MSLKIDRVEFSGSVFSQIQFPRWFMIPFTWPCYISARWEIQNLRSGLLDFYDSAFAGGRVQTGTECWLTSTLAHVW